MGKNSFVRKVYIINRTLQFEIIGTFLGGVLGALLLFTVGFLGYYFAVNTLGEGAFEQFYVRYDRVRMVEEVTQADGSVIREPYYTSQPSLPLKIYDIITPVILINNLIILVFLAIIGVFLSHRIAGPIFNINRSLDRAVEGSLVAPIHLRKKDFFHETADKINALLIHSKVIPGAGEQ